MIANILLLSHVILPHHHHNKQVCLVKSHCINDDISTGSDKKSHNHDGENTPDDCVLKELIAVSSNNLKQEFKITASSYHQPDNDAFQFNFLNILKINRLKIINGVLYH